MNVIFSYALFCIQSLTVPPVVVPEDGKIHVWYAGFSADRFIPMTAASIVYSGWDISSLVQKKTWPLLEKIDSGKPVPEPKYFCVDLLLRYQKTTWILDRDGWVQKDGKTYQLDKKTLLEVKRIVLESFPSPLELDAERGKVGLSSTLADLLKNRDR